MAGSKKPKKKHDPKRWAKSAARVHRRNTDSQPLCQSTAQELGILIHLTFKTLCEGTGTQQNFELIDRSISLAVKLADRGIGPEHMAFLKTALEAVDRAKVRPNYLITEDDAKIIADAIAVYETQIAHATKGDMRDIL